MEKGPGEEAIPVQELPPVDAFMAIGERIAQHFDPQDDQPFNFDTQLPRGSREAFSRALPEVQSLLSTMLWETELPRGRSIADALDRIELLISRMQDGRFPAMVHLGRDRSGDGAPIIFVHNRLHEAGYKSPKIR